MNKPHDDTDPNALKASRTRRMGNQDTNELSDTQKVMAEQTRPEQHIQTGDHLTGSQINRPTIKRRMEQEAERECACVSICLYGPGDYLAVNDEPAVIGVTVLRYLLQSEHLCITTTLHPPSPSCSLPLPCDLPLPSRFRFFYSYPFLMSHFSTSSRTRVLETLVAHVSSVPSPFGRRCDHIFLLYTF